MGRIHGGEIGLVYRCGHAASDDRAGELQGELLIKRSVDADAGGDSAGMAGLRRIPGGTSVAFLFRMSSVPFGGAKSEASMAKPENGFFTA